jgi:hypothetical protein
VHVFSVEPDDWSTIAIELEDKDTSTSTVAVNVKVWPAVNVDLSVAKEIDVGGPDGGASAEATGALVTPSTPATVAADPHRMTTVAAAAM